MVKIPVPGSTVGAKPWVSSGDGDVGAWNWLMHNCFRSQHTQNYQTNRMLMLLLWSVIKQYIMAFFQLFLWDQRTSDI